MFIELTDHLRCPEEHEESYLVLLPTSMEGRTVLEGHLGCPTCGKTVEVKGGVVEFGPSGSPGSAGSLTAAHAHALLGLTGPGGYLALVGSAARLAVELGSLLPGVHQVAVNPGPDPIPEGYPASVLRAPRLPLKSASMRGVVLGSGLPSSWVKDGIEATLHGLRIVGEGGPSPDQEGVEVLAVTDEVWVGRRR